MMPACVELMFGCLELQMTTKENKTRKVLQQDTEILHVSGIMWRRMIKCLYGWLLVKHTTTGCFEMIAKCLNFQQIQIFLRQGLCKRRDKNGLLSCVKRQLRVCQRQCELVETSTFTWHVQTVNFLNFLTVFHFSLSTIFLIFFPLYSIHLVNNPAYNFANNPSFNF